MALTMVVPLESFGTEHLIKSKDSAFNASHFGPVAAEPSKDKDGMPIGELTWSSSLAVVAVSFSGLFTFIFLMLACLCCKKGDIGFK
ncbi:hypothetical protein scyTo_0009421, partial [Scyliorhinus torazame]|nr:hypothetical protein [Scyliorhinus torazame]